MMDDFVLEALAAQAVLESGRNRHDTPPREGNRRLSREIP
jgi:hypothetical protein